MAQNNRLYTDDNPETTVKGLGFKDAEKAQESVAKLKSLMKKDEISRNHAIQAAVSMEQRSKHHPKRNEDMKEAENIYRQFIDAMKA